MSLPTHPCGCAGTWTIKFVFGGTTYNDSMSGYENDNPVYLTGSKPGCSNYTYIASSCDNRVMYPDFTCNAVISSISFSFTKSDPNCGIPDNIRYDCINGGCIKADTYKTPGIYQSLSDCEVACGTGCSGVCISNADWATISGLASKHLLKDCG